MIQVNHLSNVLDTGGTMPDSFIIDDKGVLGLERPKQLHITKLKAFLIQFKIP